MYGLVWRYVCRYGLQRAYGAAAPLGLPSGLKILPQFLREERGISYLWPKLAQTSFLGVVMFYPCLFYPSVNVWYSRCADAPLCAHFYSVITPSWITQQIENSPQQGTSDRRGAPNNAQKCHLDEINMDNTTPFFNVCNLLPHSLVFATLAEICIWKVANLVTWFCDAERKALLVQKMFMQIVMSLNVFQNNDHFPESFSIHTK